MPEAPPLSQPGSGLPNRRSFWRIPALLGLFALAAVGATLWGEAADWLSPANAFLTRASAVGLASIVWFAWFVTLSPASRELRKRVAVAGVGLVLIGAILFRIDRVSGDIVPRITFRFARRADQILPKASGQQGLHVNLSDTTSHDFPEFLGPGRRAMIDNVALARDWGARPPKKLWRQPIGAGWSQFSIVGDFAVTQEQRGENELITCYELKSGKLAWAHSTPVRFSATLAGVGPRATPTIHEGRVYAQGTMGHLTCLDGATGKAHWQRDIIEENRGMPLTWGQSGSPLIVDNVVVVSAGGPNGKSLVAYDKLSGEPVWGSGNEPGSYSSPALTTIGGQRQILIINASSIAAHDPSDGRVLWEHPWPGYDPGMPSVSQPLAVGDDRLLLSKGYGGGSMLIQVEHGERGWSARQLWKSNNLKTKFTNAVFLDGFAYGLDEGVLQCIDVATGAKKWKQGKYGHGQILLVGDLILVQSETGDLALVEARPSAYRELARLPAAITGTCWNPPALAGNKLLIRSEEEAACYELPLAESGL